MANPPRARYGGVSATGSGGLPDPQPECVPICLLRHGAPAGTDGLPSTSSRGPITREPCAPAPSPATLSLGHRGKLRGSNQREGSESTNLHPGAWSPGEHSGNNSTCWALAPPPTCRRSLRNMPIIASCYLLGGGGVSPAWSLISRLLLPGR